MTAGAGYLKGESSPVTAALTTSEPPGADADGELLYNGIRLPKAWPPRTMAKELYEPMPVPYLANPPAVIPIAVGRQLWVDDFLIAQTNLARVFHQPRKFAGNPVFKPETRLETETGQPVACPKSGGVWWDPADHRFKMWYEAGWIGTMAYATSVDGIHWERPDLDIQPGSNRLLPALKPDSTTVVLDHEAANPAERFKLFLRGPGGPPQPAHCLVSPDGIHWSDPVPTGDLGDRSTVFLNPFRKKWVYSIRASGKLSSKARGRSRYYREHADFLPGAKWTNDDLVFWTGADALDPRDPAIGDRVQLYNLDAVAYESVMLGFYQVLAGPANDVCMKGGFPKTTELALAYSRDGFHWHRPDRTAFISASRQEGTWNRGYVQSVGGVCAVVGDRLWFYHIGFQGDSSMKESNWLKNGMYSKGSTGLASLRRDGFVSMAANAQGGSLTTRPVTFEGEHLFVNVDCPAGELRVEMLDVNGQPIEPFTLQNCIPVAVDSTLHRVQWRGDPGLSSHRGKPVRFRFYLKSGDFYSFWVSPDLSGASHGYVGAGGPGFPGGKDTVGKAGYAPAATALRAFC